MTNTFDYIKIKYFYIEGRKIKAKTNGQTKIEKNDIR